MQNGSDPDSVLHLFRVERAHSSPLSLLASPGFPRSALASTRLILPAAVNTRVIAKSSESGSTAPAGEFD
jgi:hypothetical protein